MVNPVRPSRDGDQFHYLWAARRCLLLLAPKTDLVAIAVEGASPEERPSEPNGPAGDSVIDIAEYYGDTDPCRARHIRYVQLKHSTRRATQPWTLSGLARTLEGFAARQRELDQRFGAADLARRFEFRFVTNRPISSSVAETVRDAATPAAPRRPREFARLQQTTGLGEAELSAFCNLLHLEDRQDDCWEQRNILFQDLSGYLPDSDIDGPIQLKELVTRKALSESERDPIITKLDVLRVMRTEESRLYPAPSQIELIDKPIARQQEADLVQAIVDAEGQSAVVHALAGVGKSVFSTGIQAALPRGSATVVYDCFANGRYRSATDSRHRHRDALVQIANELAAKGLCHPLIPTARADAVDYVRAFVYRLRQAIALLRAADPSALLCIVIDAADNAEQAAQEQGEPRSFARDLVRETLTEGVRLVLLCRSHRQELLDPPPSALRLELSAFTATETAAHLRQTIPDASDQDADEFHRLTSENPRVQALALSETRNGDRDLPEILRRLGPHPTTVDDAIENLLNGAIARVRDVAGPVEREGVDRICACLATLRPRVPLDVLAAMSGVPAPAVQSLVLDLDRPLLLADDAVQFRDEPVETWFREKFRPPPVAMADLICRLRPLTAASGYVASVLPQLMLEAGQLSELVQLTLGSSALPETGALERRDVELQRAQFALKAALRARRYVDAAKLALKAGEQSAGDSRQRKLIQSNTDLAALFLDADRIQEMVARRSFRSGWLGGHHVYEAGLLSAHATLAADARSRLRMADDWLGILGRLPPEEGRREKICDADIAELVMARFNIHGADAALGDLQRWQHPAVAFRLSRLLARRLIDHGRLAAVDDLAIAAQDDAHVLLAIIVELREVRRAPARRVVARALDLISSTRIEIENGSEPHREDRVADSVTALVEAGLRLSLCSHAEAAALLARHLPATPPRWMADRFFGPSAVLLRAYCLQASLEGRVTQAADLAPAELKPEIEDPTSRHSSQEAADFARDVGALLPWYHLWTTALLGNVPKTDLRDRIEALTSASATTLGHPHGRRVLGEIARLWFDILHLADALRPEFLDALESWIDSLRLPLFTPDLTTLARRGSQRNQTAGLALRFAATSFRLTRDHRAQADTKAADYIDVARAILAASNGDARTYFDEALEAADKLGEETLPRWNAMLDLADRATEPRRSMPDVAYRFARCAEVTWEHVDDHFDWRSTVAALVALCRRSSFAILSRWRDRDFGWTPEILPFAVHALIRRGSVDARDALPLVAFDGRWDHAALLDDTLGECADAQTGEAATASLYRYMVFSRHGISKYSDLQRILTRHGRSIPDLDVRVASGPQGGDGTAAGPNTQSESTASTPGSAKTDWKEVFSGNDLTTADGIARSRAAFRRTGPPRRDEEFFAEAVRRVAVGREPEFIRAVCSTPDVNRYDLRELLPQVPESWRNRLSVMRSLGDGVKTVCRRDSMEIAKHRYWRLSPFDETLALAGMVETDVIDVVLDAVGESPDLADTERLFSLVGLLASKLDGDQALAALTYGLDLFDPVLKDHDGDGQWSEELVPPATVQESMAGYVYAGLGAPRAAVRWEAAHAVVGLCALNRMDVLRHLVAFADGGRVQPFTDAGLPFYRLHAFQWLMIAFARAATQYPEALAPFGPRLVGWALDDQPHVMIRQFAARATLALSEGGAWASDDGMEDRLRAVNVTSLPVVKSRQVERIAPDHAETPAERDEERWYFDMDIGPYWYKPLGEVFALPQHRIETEALRVIRNELHTSGSASWRDDERRRREVYDRERTYASHGAYPDTDDYQMYLSYHAMMIVAGGLLATTSTHHDETWTEADEFGEWLAARDLTRSDGRWLADRRDSAPLERPAWLDGKEDSRADCSAVTAEDFDEALTKEAMLAVWGSWSFGNRDYVQAARVRSALVSSGRSTALVRAVSTADSVHEYVIPSAQAEGQIDSGGFVLEGWLVESDSWGDLDQRDQWCGNVSYPAPAPAAEIAELMGLECDADGRIWCDREGTPVMASEVWCDVSSRDEDDDSEQGNRLRVSLGFLTALLRRSGRDLIVEVQIERRRRRSRWRRERRGDEDERARTETKVYLLTGDGRLASL